MGLILLFICIWRFSFNAFLANFNMESLIFAQKFPFTDVAKKVVKDVDIDLNKLPEKAIVKAGELIRKADLNESFVKDFNPYEEDIKFGLIAYPIAKLIISSMKKPNIVEKFSELIRKKTFEELVDKNFELSFELADELEIKYDVIDKNFVSVNLLDYMTIYFVDPETKLINKRVKEGIVILNKNDFARFLAELAYAKVFDSLPIKNDQIPKELVKISRSIDSQLSNIQQKRFDAKISGKMDPNLFPPSMKLLYDRGLGGEKLTYYERLAIGGFLQQVGMAKAEMMVFFSKSPDYKKHIVQYHVDRIYETELSAPGYVKMDEFGIYVDQSEKKYKHPLVYYNSKLVIKNRKKNKEAEDVSNK